MTKPTTSRDVSIIEGGSARRIYENTQSAIKDGKLAPDLSISRTNAFSSPFEFLFVVEGFNIREGLNTDKIRMFADRYKEGKFVPPLEVMPKAGRFQVLDGHHRYFAAELAISEGAVLARLDLQIFEGDEREAVLRMIESTESEQLSPIEKAVAYKRLKTQGMTVEEIATARKQTPLQISKMIMLANAPVRVKEAVRLGQISPTTAMDILVECEKTGQDATKVLEAAIIHAKSVGKERVTPKSVKAVSTKPKALPRKHVDTAIGTLLGSTFATQLRSALPVDAEAKDDDVVELKLPAALGRDLLAALEELEKFKAAQAVPKTDASQQDEGSAE